jgi:Kef-type K+ transport system membrane component KefB
MGVSDVFLVVGTVLLLALLLGELMERLGEPALLGEILSGVLLGPSLLGLIDPEGDFALLAGIGAVMLLFDAGYEDVDLEMLMSVRRTASVIAVLGMVLPFAAGLIIGLSFGYPGETCAFIGLALTVTSIAVTARTLIDLGKLRTTYGSKILGAAVVDDVLGLLGFSIFLILTVSGRLRVGQVLLTVGKVLLFFGAAYVVYSLIGRLSNTLSGSAQRGADFLAIMGILFILSYGADISGLDAIIGAFAAGLIIGSERRFKELEIREGIIGVAYGVFIPLFFAYVGALLDFTAIGKFNIFIFTVVVVGVLSKMSGSYLGSRLTRAGHRESLVIGVGMVPRTGVELAILTAAFSAGIVDERIYSAILALVAVSVLLTPSLLKRAISGLGEPGPVNYQ